MNNYKLPSMVKYCRAYPCHGLNSPYSRKIYGLISPYRYKTIFIRAEIHNKFNIYTTAVPIDSIFEKSLYSKSRTLSLYCIPQNNIMDNCSTVPAADEI